MNHVTNQFSNFHLGLRTLTVLIVTLVASAQQQSLPHDMLGNSRLSPEKWSAGCGIDSLYLGLKIIGVDVDYFDLIDRAKIERPGQWISIGTLWRVASEIGTHGLAVKIEGNKEAELSKRLSKSTRRTAILHLSVYQDRPEHLACAFLSKTGEIRIAGGTTFQPEVAKTWRKRWSGVVLLLSRQPFQKGDTTGQPAPRIDFDKTILDFGEVPNAGRFDYSFAIKNTGNAILHIKGALPSCTCRKPELANNIVPSGGSVAVTGNVRVGKEPGPGSAKVTITSDDPEKPRVDITLKWTVGPPLVELRPKSVIITDIVPGSSDNVLVKLSFRKDASIEPNDIGIVSHPDWIDCTLQPDGKTLKITVSPTWPSGKRSGRVVLTLKSFDSKLVLPVEVEVVPKIIITPAMLFCSREPNKKFAAKQIKLCPATDKDVFKVLGASIHNVPGNVNVCKDPNNSNVWNLEAKIGPFTKKSAAFLVGYITVKTSHDNAGEIRIPVFVN